jgi:hypothetical protein
MVDKAEAIHPENKSIVSKFALSRTVFLVEQMNTDFLTQLNDTVQTFEYFCLVLDGNTGVDCAVHLLISTGGLNDGFHVIQWQL